MAHHHTRVTVDGANVSVMPDAEIVCVGAVTVIGANVTVLAGEVRVTGGSVI